MAVDTATYSFADLLSNIVDNRGKTCPVAEDGLPLIATNCVKNETLFPVFEKVRYVDQETYDTWFRGHPEPGDMIFVTKGSPGNVCWTPDPVNFCIAQDMVAIRANRDIVDPKYLFALLRSPMTQSRILNMHVGTLIPHFKKGDFKNLFFEIPKDQGLQRAIGEIYFSFCEKIELNRQMNATLEAMAQARFKSWFVNFDPVIDNALAAGNPIPEPLHARAEARKALGDQRKPLSEAIQKQFPCRFVINEDMGWVPEGWDMLPLDKIANYQNGLALQKFRPENEDDYLPVVKIAQLKKGWADGEEKASPNIKPECIIDDGDVVFSWSGSLVVDVWCGGKAALNQHLFKVTSKIYPKWFFYQFTNHHLHEFQRIAADKAVTMGHIKREHLSKALCSTPDSGLLDSVGKMFDALMRRGIANRVESRLLEETRDTLLPKLLSGQLRIPDAEKRVAEAI